MLLSQAIIGPPRALAAEPSVTIRSFLGEPAICRAGRPVGLTAVVVNNGDADANVTATLRLPEGLRLVSASPSAPIRRIRSRSIRQLPGATRRGGAVFAGLEPGGDSASLSVAFRALPHPPFECTREHRSVLEADLIRDGLNLVLRRVEQVLGPLNSQ